MAIDDSGDSSYHQNFGFGQDQLLAFRTVYYLKSAMNFYNRSENVKLTGSLDLSVPISQPFILN
jgi:hypothetical protein